MLSFNLSVQLIDELCLFFASQTKIERQEIILSIEYSIIIIFIGDYVDKLQNQESCMHKCLVH